MKKTVIALACGMGMMVSAFASPESCVEGVVAMQTDQVTASFAAVIPGYGEQVKMMVQDPYFCSLK